MNIRQRIVTASERYQRNEDSVQLLAVSKRHPAGAVYEAYEAGQTHFGENFVNEALLKQAEIAQMLGSNANENKPLTWHFIGKIQSNKARQIARNFTWVHSLDRYKVAKRLDHYCDAQQPLNVLVQVNLSNNPERPGVAIEEVEEFVARVNTFDNLRIRGLMAVAPATDDYETQFAAFAQVKHLLDKIQVQNASFDQLSMGMSGDLEAAIANGATWVRIGTDVFGKRPAD